MDRESDHITLVTHHIQQTASDFIYDTYINRLSFHKTILWSLMGCHTHQNYRSFIQYAFRKHIGYAN